MIKLADKWTDYEVIAAGGGEKLERFGSIYLLRPDPQAIWPAPFKLANFKGLNGHYKRSKTGGGAWENLTKIPEEWQIKYGGLAFSLKPMDFKHLGIFPEQAANWDLTSQLIRAKKGQSFSVLNLFAYTGGASVAAASSGAKVTHVDAARGMVDRAKINAELCGVKDSVRFIVDDCAKFIAREIKRGVRYDAVIMDPPSFGRGPNGETWKIEDDLFPLVSLAAKVLCDSPAFFLINSYTTGLQPQVIGNILSIALSNHKGNIDCYEVGLPVTNGNIILPCGCSGLWTSR